MDKDKGRLPEDKPINVKGIAGRRMLANRARELVEQYPDWSNKQVNALLRLDYSGKYLSPNTMDKIRKGVEIYPVKMPYFHAEVPPGMSYQILCQEGFSTYEAREFVKGLSVDIDSPALAAMRRTRIKWMSKRLRRGWSVQQVRRAVNDYYTKPRRSPFDFLKASYAPKVKADASRYKQALENRRHRKLLPSEKRARQITSAFYNR